MSTHRLRYTELYRNLEESIDFENAKAITLAADTTARIEIEGMSVGVRIEQFSEHHHDYFARNSVLANNFNWKTYFNLGFDIGGATTQTAKTNYGTLAKILGVVAKSTLEWIKKEDPDVVTITADATSDREFGKKLSIYYSILYNNKGLLGSMGYVADRGRMADGESFVYIAKKGLWDSKKH